MTYLNMADNQLGPKAGLAFARSLKDNHCLAHLDLSTNRLGFRAGTAFAIAMMHNTSLVSINMKNNDFGPNDPFSTTRGKGAGKDHGASASSSSE